MRLSDRLKREHAYVESQLGDRIICDRQEEILERIYAQKT